MKRQLHDLFFTRAKALGYTARSAFKLQEIQKKHRVITAGASVLDLGCCPGSWLQVACQSLGHSGGCVVGIDLQNTPLPDQHCDCRVNILQGDALTASPATFQAPLPEWAGGRYRVVLSDMAPPTSGAASCDALQSVALARCAARLALSGAPPLLAQGGNLVVKILEGEGLQDFFTDVRPYFKRVVRMRPRAVRRVSRELYVVCLGSRTLGEGPFSSDM